MNISFTGLDTFIFIDELQVTTFEICNKNLFCRICESLISDKCMEALEPYSCWESNEEKVAAAKRPLVIVSPLDLPWDARQLSSSLLERMDMLVKEDDEQRLAIEKTGQELLSLLSDLYLQLDADYCFDAEWDLLKQLKTFGLCVNMEQSSTHIEKVESFISFVSDVQLKRPLIFINFKEYFSDEDIQRFINFVIYQGRQVLLMESEHDDRSFLNERKYTVDQYFLEY